MLNVCTQKCLLCFPFFVWPWRSATLKFSLIWLSVLYQKTALLHVIDDEESNLGLFANLILTFYRCSGVIEERLEKQVYWKICVRFCEHNYYGSLMQQNTLVHLPIIWHLHRWAPFLVFRRFSCMWYPKVWPFFSHHFPVYNLRKCCGKDGEVSWKWPPLLVFVTPCNIFLHFYNQ